MPRLSLNIISVDKLSIGELFPGSKLPKHCPQRHIQYDSSFCLGLEKKEIRCETDALAWWESLEAFLILQLFAEKSKFWLAENQLDHGDAGIHHKAALELADQLGIQEQYMLAHAGYKSWITELLPDYVNRRGRPTLGSKICPIGCTKEDVPVCLKKCKHRVKMTRLFQEELNRQIKLEEYWDSLRNQKFVCCNTMLDCPAKGFYD